jgi:ABC-2 type transport system ATP-binding protein
LQKAAFAAGEGSITQSSSASAPPDLKSPGRREKIAALLCRDPVAKTPTRRALGEAPGSGSCVARALGFRSKQFALIRSSGYAPPGTRGEWRSLKDEFWPNGAGQAGPNTIALLRDHSHFTRTIRAGQSHMIEIRNLSKRYGELTAVNDISFSVSAGQVLGFLGPNGAGKSTTMKMITGFLAPTAGSITVCGHDVETAPLAAKACMGYLPEGAPSYGEMTVRGFLEFIAEIRNLPADRRRTRLDDVIARLQLDSVLEQMIETLSKGFKRRVGLAQALIHDPQVLILDEPTDGLDPNQKHQVRELISNMAKDKIIVISTHILEEVDAVCNRAIIIANGKLLADDTPKALAKRAPSGRLDDVFRQITTAPTAKVA